MKERVLDMQLNAYHDSKKLSIRIFVLQSLLDRFDNFFCLPDIENGKFVKKGITESEG